MRLPRPETSFKSFWFSRRTEISFACAAANSAESFATVSVKVATVALSAVVAVARLAKESESSVLEDLVAEVGEMLG